MNPDEIERRLRTQPFRRIPAAWREEVLGLANRTTAPFVTSAEAENRVGLAAVCEPANSADLRRASVRAWFSEWLWPSPVAWGALAACWVGILLLERAAQPSAIELAEASANARLALAYQTLVRDFGASESGRNPRPASPADRPSVPDQSGARPPSPSGRAQATQRGKAATEAVGSWCPSGPNAHASRRAAMALTRGAWGEEDRESASEFAGSRRASATIAVQYQERNLANPQTDECSPTTPMEKMA